MQTGAPDSLWECAIHWAADCLNVRTDPVTRKSAYEAYFGHKPDMTACCEFYASVAALDKVPKAIENVIWQTKIDSPKTLSDTLAPRGLHHAGCV